MQQSPYNIHSKSIFIEVPAEQEEDQIQAEFGTFTYRSIYSGRAPSHSCDSY